jgi:uroporphyrinogen-III decarboxylase
MWMNIMNSRDRVLKVFNFEKPDRVPIYDLLRNHKAIEYYSGEKITYNESDRYIVIKAITKSLDMIRSIRLPQLEYIFEEEGFLIHQQEWTSWIEKRPFDNKDSAKRWIRGQINKLEQSLPYLEKWIEGKFKEYISLQFDLEDTLLLWTATELGFTEIYTKLGIENTVYIYFEEPTLISDWLELKCEQTIRYIKSFLNKDLVPVAFIGEDIAYKNALLFSPSFLKKEFIPRLKRIIQAYHTKGIKVIFHSDGNLLEILDDLIECGIDGLNPLEPLAGMDIGKIKRRIGEKVVLIGNIDCSQLLPFGTTEEVKNEVKKTIEIAAPGSGFILASSSELHNEIPLENILALIGYGQKYGSFR